MTELEMLSAAHAYGLALEQYVGIHKLLFASDLDTAIEAEEMLLLVCKVNPPSSFKVLLHLAKNGHLPEAGAAYIANKDEIAVPVQQAEVENLVRINRLAEKEPLAQEAKAAKAEKDNAPIRAAIQEIGPHTRGVAKEVCKRLKLDPSKERTVRSLVTEAKRAKTK